MLYQGFQRVTEGQTYHLNQTIFLSHTCMQAQLFLFIWNTFTLCITRQTQLKMKLNLDFPCLNSFWKFSLWISFHFNRPKQREILIILQLISNIIFITVIVYQSNICRLSISFLSVGYFLILANIFEFILWSWLHFITWFEEYSPISCPITFSEVEYF